jgi:hypothetical protein
MKKLISYIIFQIRLFLVWSDQVCNFIDQIKGPNVTASYFYGVVSQLYTQRYALLNM